MRELDTLLALGGGGGMRSMWFSVGVVVLQAWAGFELVRMSPQSRIIATVFGIVSSAVTLYIYWPVFQSLKHMRLGGGLQNVLMFAPIALGLVVPVATVILVNRKIAPTARARFRQKPTDQQPQPPA